MIRVTAWQLRDKKNPKDLRRADIGRSCYPYIWGRAPKERTNFKECPLPPPLPLGSISSWRGHSCDSVNDREVHWDSMLVEFTGKPLSGVLGQQSIGRCCNMEPTENSFRGKFVPLNSLESPQCVCVCVGQGALWGTMSMPGGTLYC